MKTQEDQVENTELQQLKEKRLKESLKDRARQAKQQKEARIPI